MGGATGVSLGGAGVEVELSALLSGSSEVSAEEGDGPGALASEGFCWCCRG